MEKQINNAYILVKEKEKDGKKFTNFYLILGNGLLSVQIDLKTFGDKSIYYRVKKYCENNK